jgi:hypothetical protein
MVMDIKIVTVVKNDDPGLLETAKSIIRLSEGLQTITITHIVIDGNPDGDLRQLLSGCYSDLEGSNITIKTQSELDSGIYDAMNKALRYIRFGDIVWYLNAGDTVSEMIDIDLFEKAVMSFYKSNNRLSFYVANCYFENKSWEFPEKNIDANKFSQWLKHNTPVHQAVLFKHTPEYPLHYMRSFRIQSDSILIYYIAASEGIMDFHNNIICNYRVGGYSNNYLSFRKVVRQTIEQFVVLMMREDTLYSKIRLIPIMSAKYVLSHISGARFSKIHSIINQYRYKP